HFPSYAPGKTERRVAVLHGVLLCWSRRGFATWFYLVFLLQHRFEKAYPLDVMKGHKKHEADQQHREGCSGILLYLCGERTSDASLDYRHQNMASIQHRNRQQV